MVVAVVREIILYGQGYGAIKTWEKKIFYDLLWPNEISDLNNFNTTSDFSQDFLQPKKKQRRENLCRINFLKMQPQKCATFLSGSFGGRAEESRSEPPFPRQNYDQ